MLLDEHDECGRNQWYIEPGDGRKFVFAVFCFGSACVIAHWLGWI